jgi:hypothetical protein
LVEFFDGPGFPFYFKLPWYPWPIVSLGGSVFWEGRTTKGKRYPRRTTSIQYMMYKYHEYTESIPQSFQH